MEGEWLQADVDAVLALQPVDEHVELEPTDRTHDGHGARDRGGEEEQNRSFLREMAEPPVQVFAPECVFHANLSEQLRREPGDPRILDQLTHRDRVADAQASPVV